ncbi:DUF6114 domain-containing protein [Streptomyces sp. NPDC060035]|uniref:DUF6114 domain-containing protein n=1 Tax=Streptomyces sp. NPDC060035 TaxID=3347044 RepID=UPI0036C6FF0A
MIALVLGFGAELMKETGSRLDRVLPAPGLRRPLRAWRRRRPFWAGVWTVLGGLEMIFLPLAPLPLMLKVGIGAMSAIGVGLVLIAGGLFFVFVPVQRLFVSVVTAIASLVSLATTNLGGFGIGVGLGLLGSSMAFGWMPDRTAPSAPDRALPKSPDRTAPVTRDVPDPKAGESRAPHPSPAAPAAGEGPALRTRTAHRVPRLVALPLCLALTGALVAAAPGQGNAATACQDPGGVTLPWPFDGLTPPWDEDECAPEPTPAPGTTAAPTPGLSGSASTSPTPSPSASGEPEPSASASAPSEPSEPPGEQVTLPCLTGVDTGGLDNPPPGGDPPSRETAKPGPIKNPDDLTALTPPLAIGDRPGPGRATYPVGPHPPEVGATRLDAYDAIIHGTTYLPTVGGGRVKVLWIHAERLVAKDYRFRVEGPDGTPSTIDVQLDIRNVDVYATVLTASIRIPVIGVDTPRICIGADIIPANLPVSVRLPRLTAKSVEAGQVLVDAGDVRFTGLTAGPRT